LKQLFDRHFSQSLAALNLRSRRVIELENPFVPTFVPLSRTEWWFDPLAVRKGR